MKSKFVIGYCTFPNEAIAEQISEMLVSEGTIACANIYGPIRSIYRWGGRLQKEKEWVAILKTAETKKATLMERDRATHPYTNPCLVFAEISGGLPDFLKWIYTQTV